MEEFSTRYENELYASYKITVSKNNTRKSYYRTAYKKLNVKLLIKVIKAKITIK